MAYLGFAKLKGKLAKKGGVRNPGAVAAAIGRRKYGAKKFNRAARTGRKLGGKQVPIHNVGDAMREMKAGSKHIKTRAQAIAVGLKAEREGGLGGKKLKRSRRLTGGRSLS